MFSFVFCVNFKIVFSISHRYLPLYIKSYWELLFLWSVLIFWSSLFTYKYLYCGKVLKLEFIWLSTFLQQSNLVGKKIFLNKGSGALQKSRQLKKGPHISPFEDSASFSFFWGNKKESCFLHISYFNLVSYSQLNINRFQVNTNACRFPSLQQKKVSGTDMPGSCCEADEPLVWGLLSSGYVVGKRTLGSTVSSSALATPCFNFCLSSLVWSQLIWNLPKRYNNGFFSYLRYMPLRPYYFFPVENFFCNKNK